MSLKNNTAMSLSITSLIRMASTAAIVTSVMVMGNTAYGRQLSPREALENAVGKTQSTRLMSRSGKSATATSLAYTVETEGTPTVYVFTRNGGGYWVVAANDAVPNGLLGYTDNGVFEAEDMPANISWVLEQYGDQIAFAAAQESSAENEVLAGKSRSAVSPLLETRWGQTGVYSKYCPEVDGRHCPTGCVATAMAQIMYSHRYPEVGAGTVRYRPSGFSEYLEYDFSANPIDWETMVSAGGSASTSASGDAVARLMQACGMSVKMSYKLTGSGSSLITAARALVKNFGYDKDMAMLERDYFTESEWDELLYNELSAGRAVLYSGRSNVEGGHAFVIDGYSEDGYYHVNWGWDGVYDGYFVLTSLDPRNNNAGFNYDEQMIVGIRPAGENSAVRPVMAFQGDMSLQSMNVTRATYGELKITASRGLFNNSVSQTTVYFGVKLTSTEDGSVQYVSSSNSKTLLAGQAITNYVLRQNAFPKSGRYLMEPAVKGENGQWYSMMVSSDSEKAMYVDCTTTAFVFTPESEVIAAESVKDIQVTYLAVKADALTGETFDIEAHFCNTSDHNYTKYLTPTLMENGDAVAAGTKLTLELGANELNSSEWSCTLNEEVEEGTYKLALIDRKNNVIGTPIDVKVVSDTTSGLRIVSADGDTTGEEVMTEVYTLDGRLAGSYQPGETFETASGVYVLRHLMSDGTVNVEKKMFR